VTNIVKPQLMQFCMRKGDLLVSFAFRHQTLTKASRWIDYLFGFEGVSGRFTWLYSRRSGPFRQGVLSLVRMPILLKP
jgi:hypothetical protein